METFSSGPQIQDFFELGVMDEHSNDVEMVEADNPHDTTDDALETILMEEETAAKKVVSSQQSSVSSLPSKTALDLSQNNIVMATQPVKVLSQDKPSGMFTKYVLKKGTPTSMPMQSNTFAVAAVGQQKTQTVMVHKNNLTLSPIKGGFKIPISPLKNPLKVSVIPSSNASTIRTINLNSAVQNNGRLNQPHSNFQFQTLVTPQTNTAQTRPVAPQNLTLQQPGGRVQCLRLVPASGAQNSVPSSIPVTNLVATQKSTPTSIPVGGAIVQQPGVQSIVNVKTVQKPAQLPQVKTQRLIMPANTIQQSQASIANISPGSLLQAGNVGYAMVPAKYVEQLKKQLNSQMLLNADSSSPATAEPRNAVPALTKASSNGKMRKSCNCSKSMCLKLYCECFANGHFCEGCNCINCHNNLEYEGDRSKAIKSCLERNPSAFRPKIGRGCDDNRTHQKGCNCKRSGCLKNYCECYEAHIPCTSKCKCIGCKNVEEDSAVHNEQHSLMNLADAAAARSQQQSVARSNIDSRLGDIRPSRVKAQTTVSSSGEKLPSTFFTQEVIEATCTCLLAQAEEAEKTNRPMQVAEMMILEEFGKCLMQIIQSAGKTKTLPSS